MEKKQFKKEVKHIRAMGKVLQKLSYELQDNKKFKKEDLELLKSVGSTVAFKGCALSWVIDDLEETKHE